MWRDFVQSSLKLYFFGFCSISPEYYVSVSVSGRPLSRFMTLPKTKVDLAGSFWPFQILLRIFLLRNEEETYVSKGARGGVEDLESVGSRSFEWSRSSARQFFGDELHKILVFSESWW